MTREERKKEFTRTLAHFLVDNQAAKGLLLASGDALAQEWAVLRASSGVFGYPDFEDTLKQLEDLLK